jgi:hypothetical protein
LASRNQEQRRRKYKVGCPENFNQKPVKSENEVSWASEFTTRAKEPKRRPHPVLREQKFYPHLCAYNLIRAKMFVVHHLKIEKGMATLASYRGTPHQI